MKNFKKIIASILVIVIMITAAPIGSITGLDFNLDWLDFSTKSSALASNGKCGENVTYTFNKNTGALIISGTGAMYYYSPFRNNSAIKTVVIKNGVTSIDDGAFYYCKNLTGITIPDSVTSIGGRAFYNCTSLKSITIGNGVTSLGSSAFYWCESLTSITIPDSVTSIGNRAFEGCTRLANVTVDKDNKTYDSRDNCNAIIETSTNSLIVGCRNTVIPDSVTSIGDGAFYYCKNLIGITIPNSVISIGDYAFEDCTGLTSVTIGNSVTSIGYCAFKSCKNLTSITIPNSVTRIGYSAFNNCTSLTSITIPDSVTSIGDEAFCRCTGLTSITLPNSLTSIGRCAFDRCTSLTSIVVDKDNNVYDSRDNCNAIIETSTNTLIQGCQNTTIPDSVISIGYGAFADCTSLTSVTIPDSVTSIGIYAFEDCANLTRITIPDSVTSIGSSAFYGCIGLTSVTIPDSVTSIGSSAFYGCIGLTSVTIPDSVTSIGSFAFESCTSLTSITIPDSVTSIGERAFYNCTSLTSVKIGKGVTSIYAEAFENCRNVTFNYTKCENCFDNITGASAFRIYLENSKSKLVCAKCNGETSYVDNHDGTHTINKTCSMCNKIYFTDTKSCEYSNHACKYCNHTQPIKTIKIKTGDKNYTYTYTGYTIPTYEDVNIELKLKHLKVTSYYYVDDAGKFVDIPESASIPVGVSTVFARCKTTSILWLTSSENSTYISNIFSYCLYKVFPALLGI